MRDLFWTTKKKRNGLKIPKLMIQIYFTLITIYVIKRYEKEKVQKIFALKIYKYS